MAFVVQEFLNVGRGIFYDKLWSNSFKKDLENRISGVFNKKIVTAKGYCIVSSGYPISALMTNGLFAPLAVTQTG